jgi:predicted transcriptional regulator
MTGRTLTVQLTDEQAALLDELAADREATSDALLLEAVAHGLAMIAAGVDESDLQEPWDRPGADQGRPLTAADFAPMERRPGNSDMGDDLPF